MVQIVLFWIADRGATPAPQAAPVTHSFVELLLRLSFTQRYDQTSYFIMYLPDGPQRPDPAELEKFWRAACDRSPDLTQGPGYQVRWIGLDHDTTEQILALILAKDKTGTFTLPWIVERTDQPNPRPGDPIILIDFSGKPRALVRRDRPARGVRRLPLVDAHGADQLR